MNISGTRTYAGFYDYNTIKSQEEKTQQIVDAKADAMREEALQAEVQEEKAVESLVEKKPDTGAIDYVKRYQPDATYELKGVDSDIANLDVQKALSEMKMDQILEQYQFFVGAGSFGEEAIGKPTDENFFL